MKGHSLIKIHSKGGLFTTQEIRSIAKTALYQGVDGLHLGTRQELYFHVKDEKKEVILKKLQNLELNIFEDQKTYNIVTSMPSVNVFSNKTWLNSGVYLDVIDSFKINPKLKIGLIDPEQELTPILHNQINFVASDDPGYWYMYLCLEPNKKPYLWPVKVDTYSIYQLAKLIGGMFIGDKISDGDELVSIINDNIDYHHLAFTNAPELPNHSMPSYDGIHNAGNETFWLGITQQENKFSVSFLEALAYQCQQQKINNIYFTTWGSILIRNISKNKVADWNNLLTEHAINTGHAHSELNWLMAEMDEEAREIKRKVVSYFYKKNARTEGLTFGINTGKKEIFSNVIIKQKPILPLLNWNKYDIYHAKDFNDNTKEYELYKKGISKKELPKKLYKLCLDYSKYISKKRKLNDFEDAPAIKEEFNDGVHQCNDCMTVYDPQYGDPDNGILPGTPFAELPSSYTCSLCGAEKERFSELTIKETV